VKLAMNDQAFGSNKYVSNVKVPGIYVFGGI